MLSYCGTDFMHSEPGEKLLGPWAGKADPVLVLCPQGRDCCSVWTMPKSGLIPMITSEIPENS